MAAKRAPRATARKVKDKWRSKEWYRILAPEMFNNVQIAETLSDDSAKVIGRVTEVTMQDLTGDFSKMHIKLMFKIHEVNGFDAHTNFIGHTLTSDYIRRLTRRKHSKTDGVFDAITKDKALIRVKPMAVTEKRIQVSQQKAIRSIMGKIITSEAAKSISSEFIKEMLSGNISKSILRASKPIYPLKRVEIRRSEVLRSPTEKVVAPPPQPLEEVAVRTEEELEEKPEELAGEAVEEKIDEKERPEETIEEEKAGEEEVEGKEELQPKPEEEKVVEGEGPTED